MVRQGDVAVFGDSPAMRTQLAGVTLDLSTPNCTIDSSQLSVTCRLTRLPAGTDAPIRIGARLDTRITGTLINSAIVTAKADLDKKFDGELKRFDLDAIWSKRKEIPGYG